MVYLGEFFDEVVWFALGVIGFNVFAPYWRRPLEGMIFDWPAKERLKKERMGFP